MRWADTTQGARTHRKEVRKIEHPASGVEESPTYETESCSLHDQSPKAYSPIYIKNFVAGRIPTRRQQHGLWM